MNNNLIKLSTLTLFLLLNINTVLAKNVPTAKKAPTADKTLEVTLLTRTVKSWDGKLLPDYPSGQPEISVIKIILPPQGRYPIHKHPVITVAVLLKGEITVYLEDGSQKMKFLPGKVDTEVVNTWHYAINEGTEPAEVIIFYAGIKGIPISIKK